MSSQKRTPDTSLTHIALYIFRLPDVMKFMVHCVPTVYDFADVCPSIMGTKKQVLIADPAKSHGPVSVYYVLKSSYGDLI